MMTFCAAMFHDVGKGIGEHGQTGAEMVRFLLKDELTPGEIDEVARLVYAHNHRAPGTGKWDLWAQLLNLDEAKRIYDERVQFNKEFAARMAVEAEGGYVV